MGRNTHNPRPDRFTSQDTWVLARLWNGMAEEPDLSQASPAFEPFFRRVFALTSSGREAVVKEWLDSCADADAIRRAVNEIDPAQPLPDDPPTGNVARLICLADIKPLTVEWLWRGRVPLGMLTMFAGDPKLGKSFVTLTMAAAVSRGAPMPFGDVPDGPASVIIMSAEDDASRTIVPRLIAAGADLSRIHTIESIRMLDGIDAPPSLDTDLLAIEVAANRLGDCRLILIDPITAYLGGIDDHRNADLRALLAPLNDLAERQRIAIVLVSHLSKGGGSNGKHRVMGSMAYVGVCRANLIFVRDQTDPTGRRVLLCDNGGNLAPAAPTLAFTIEELQDGPAVVFQPEPVSITTEKAIADEARGEPDRRPAPDRREAERWLRDILSAGALPAGEVEESALGRDLQQDAPPRPRGARGRGHPIRLRQGIHLPLGTAHRSRPMTPTSILGHRCRCQPTPREVAEYGSGGRVWRPQPGL